MNQPVELHPLTGAVAAGYNVTFADFIVWQKWQFRDLWVEYGLMSHQTHYRYYRGRFLLVGWPNQQCQALKYNSWSVHQVKDLWSELRVAGMKVRTTKCWGSRWELTDRGMSVSRDKCSWRRNVVCTLFTSCPPIFRYTFAIGAWTVGSGLNLSFLFK